jgi:hypothetical protein
MSPNSKIIRVSEAISPDLMFRSVANSFFDELERREAKNLILDFAAVRSVSRSFAHQYSVRKKASSKDIEETNMTRDVSRMFQLASQTQEKSMMTLPRISKTQVITV